MKTKKNTFKTSKDKTSKKSKKNDIIQVNIRNVKLTKESRKMLRKIKEPLFGNVANAIECGNWWIPVKNHKYTHMKSEFENGMYDFYDIDKRTVKVEIEEFMTDIIEFDNHR